MQKPYYEIPLSEIATALETIGQVMVSDGLAELAGYNASFYKDAGAIVALAETHLARYEVAMNSAPAHAGNGEDHGYSFDSSK